MGEIFLLRVLHVTVLVLNFPRKNAEPQEYVMILLVGKGLSYGVQVEHISQKVRTRCLAVPGVSFLFGQIFLVNAVNAP